jgi:hypothetical protein
MKKIIWSDASLDQSNTVREFGLGREPGGLDAARGLLIGLAISQVFWLALAVFVVRFWTHRI